MIKVKSFVLSAIIFLAGSLGGALLLTQTANAATCQPSGNFFGLPTWYKFLDGQMIDDASTGAQLCQPVLDDINDVWKIVAAVLELLLRVASLIAIGFVVYGGVLYIASQGSPDKTKQALSTVVSAIVGLVITITAAAIVSFVAARFTSAPNSTPITNDRNGPR